jgi:hypothetical protein
MVPKGAALPGGARELNGGSNRASGSANRGGGSDGSGSSDLAKGGRKAWVRGFKGKLGAGLGKEAVTGAGVPFPSREVQRTWTPDSAGAIAGEKGRENGGRRKVASALTSR